MHYPHKPHRSHHFTSYREGEWKVIYHYFPSKESEDSHYQLYHLAKDPFEQKNLAGSEPKQLRRLMKNLSAEMKRQNALYPVDPESGKPQKPKLP